MWSGSSSDTDYVLVAPFEVHFRTLDYGIEGGVELDPDPDS